MPAFVIDRLTADEAAAIARWTYPPPYDVYDGDGDVGLMTTVAADGTGYFGIHTDDSLVGFACFGADARVRGQAEEGGTLDVGCGVHPDLVSRGMATSFLPDVVAFARRQWSPRRLRVAVASFNERSLRLCRTAGFQPVREFVGPADRPFTELVLDLEPGAP